MKTTIGIFVFTIAVCFASSCHAKTSLKEGGILHSAISTHSNDTTLEQPEQMDNDIKKLSSLFSKMVENSTSFGGHWKNLQLGPEAFTELTENLPLRIKGELTPYTRIILLNKMLDCMTERDCPRFILKVREYQQSMFPLIEKDDIEEDMDIDEYEGDPARYHHFFTEKDLLELKQKTLDYLNPEITMEQWCEKYECHLKFDEIERSEIWEKEIYSVEKAVARKLHGVSFRMGYCFEYWSTKRAVLAKHGIEWRSPSSMNPTVMFD